jgi:conjugal transfer pilus assembly protein TraE
MDMKIFERNHEEVLTSNAFCKKISIIMSIVALFSIVGLVLKDQIVIVAPPEMQEEYQLTSAKASESYKTAWALSLSKLVGNMSKEEAPFIIKQLSSMMSSGIYNDVRRALYAHVEMIQKKKITTDFATKEVYFEKRSNKVFVHGVLTMDSLVSNKKDKVPFTFEFSVELSSYKPAITHFSFYTGKPRAEGVNFDREALEKEQNGE